MPNDSSTHTIRVGILHSLTGTMAISETPLVDAALMAIAEINAAGGLLGLPIEPVICDGASKLNQFTHMAKQLIEIDSVTTVFGCWTSMSRKAVTPIFEAHNILLWYPLQYEGLEDSSCIFYTGSCPSQQVKPAINWLLEQGKKNIYLVGSDYVFPQVANKLIKGQVKGRGYISGEAYRPLGSKDFQSIIDDILQQQPDAIFSTLNGDSNLAFYEQCAKSGIIAEKIPIMAVSVAEAELQRIGKPAVGHYACWSYFQSLTNPNNQRFVQNFKAQYGPQRVTSDPIEAAYTQVHLWAKAVAVAQSAATDLVRQATYHSSFDAPGGTVYCETNHHLHKDCYIGKIQSDGQFDVVFSSKKPLEPLPWLGVEKQPLKDQQVLIEMLRELSQGVQYNWVLKQQSELLENTTGQLRREIEQRKHTEEALKIANSEIIALNKSLRKDKDSLEQRVKERTQDLESTLSTLKDTQIQLIQTEKMSSLGQMVAGIAHEVNNPINFIYGNTRHLHEYVTDLTELISLYTKAYSPTTEIELKQQEIDLDFLLEDIHKIVNSIDVGTGRVKQLVSSLRNFSRLDESEVKDVDLHEGLESTLVILGHRLRSDYEVVKDYGELPLIRCYPAQLNQVFTNIIANAIDAMSETRQEHKKLVIETRAIASDKVQISFKDNGLGMTQNVCDKIFDPFFTTKTIGKGTGLGLGICFQIVQKHQGKIEVISTPNEGTEFIVTLPVKLPISQIRTSVFN
ncbi:MAG: transporter substrate-binding protein [Limnothrix sp.]